MESAGFAVLRQQVAARLLAQASDIALRWEHQAREVALRPASQSLANGELSSAVPLVEAIASALSSESGAMQHAVPLGLALGTEAFEQGASLHHAMKGIDLLSAMVLYAVERITADEELGMGTVADGVRLSRRLQSATALLALAVTKGYTQAVSDGLRDSFRHLRHDLRNPLGTIRSVLALMEDESMPADARANPRFRAMARRNAISLDSLIMARLSDAAALLPSLAHQLVSLRTIACAVRRDLRAEADSREVTIGVSEDVIRVRVDAVGLELLLRGLLQAALEEAVAGDELVVEFAAVEGSRTGVIVTVDPPRPPITCAEVARALVQQAQRMGVKLELGARALASIPVRSDEPLHETGAAAADSAVPAQPVALADRDTRDHLRRTGEGDDGETGAR